MPESVYPDCPKCGKEIHKQTIDQMVDQIMSMPERPKSSCWPLWSEGARASM